RDWHAGRTETGESLIIPGLKMGGRSRAIHFYRDVLGLTFVSRDVVARFDVDGVLFELVPTTDASKLLGSGNARLCLRVESLEHAIDELRANGVSVRPPEDKGAGILAILNDPDGNEVCLWQYSSVR
ncbi:MAG: VOC family protein, partial [Candidatus Sulfotelmatobacter sp.]